MLNQRSIEIFPQLNFKGLKSIKKKNMEEQFANPIIKVDLHSGAILSDRLKEVWESESVVCIAS